MLTDDEIQRLQPNVKPDGSYTEKPYKISCSKNLYILINPYGSKLWRFKYRYGGKDQLLSLGAYPAVSLEQAIRKRDEYRQMLREGINPSLIRKKYKQESALAVQAEKLASRFLYGDTGALLIKLDGRELLLEANDVHDLKIFLNTYPAGEV
jgi:hypothetical protein